MKKIEGIPGGALALALLLAMPTALGAERPDDTRNPVAEAALQGQGRGQGRGDDDRGQARRQQGSGSDREVARASQGGGNAERSKARGQGNQGRGNDDARPQGNQGGGNADARGQGNQGRGNDNARGQGNQGRGNDRDAGARGRDDSPGRSGVARGRRDRPSDNVVRVELQRLPEPVRRLAASTRRGERIAGNALLIASLRGASPDRFRIVNDASRVRVLNRNDAVLLDLSDDDARNLGHWRMRRLGDEDARERNGSPAFCRSGAGHPVWGRDWCLDKGFGLGVGERSIWSRASVDDVIFKRRPDAQITLDRGGLIDVLGDIVLGRLAVQSLALGYQEPLAGRWVYSPQEPEAPWILRVNAGDIAVAEFVDTNRDNDVDVLFVTQPRW